MWNQSRYLIVCFKIFTQEYDLTLDSTTKGLFFEIVPWINEFVLFKLILWDHDFNNLSAQNLYNFWFIQAIGGNLENMASGLMKSEKNHRSTNV